MLYYVNPSRRRRFVGRFRRTRRNGVLGMGLSGRFQQSPDHKPRPKRRRKLFGAALAAHQKKTGRSKKRRKLFGAALAAHQKKTGKRKKATSRRPRRTRRRTKTGGMHMAKRRRRKAHSKITRKRKRKGTAGKVVRRRKRRKAAAVAPKRRRRKRRHVSRKRGRGPARRARKTRRRRRRSYRRTHRIRARGVSLTLRTNPRRRRRRRRNPLYSMNPRRRRSRRHYRRNPATAIVGIAKSLLPFAGGFYLSRMASKYSAKVPGLDKLGQHAPPVFAVGLMVAVHFLAKKVRFLSKYRTPLMVGMGINAIDTIIKTYLPSVAGAIGAGGEVAVVAVPQKAAADYVDLQDYIDVGDYIDLEDYQELGAYEEMGADYAELGAFSDQATALQIGTGIGSPSFLKQVPAVSMVGPVPGVPMVAQVPAWAPASESSLYTGIFAKNRGGFGSLG